MTGGPDSPAPATPPPVLKVSDLEVAFWNGDAWRQVLHKVSFDVARNETVALVGESGSGKSVTSLAAMGLLPRGQSAIAGSVQFDGRELVGLAESRMRPLRGRDIAMVFQEPMTSLNPVFKIGDQVAEVLTAHHAMGQRQARAEALRLLEKVRIPAARRRLDEFPHQLSGGMRQRVVIAMALALKPKLLIADEPTTALDVTIQAQVLELIKELQADEGMAVLFITHDMGVVAEMADRTVVMYHGNVVEQGPTAQIFAAPREAYTRRLLNAVPRIGSMAGVTQPRRFNLGDEAEKDAPLVADRPARKSAADTPLLSVRDLVVRFNVRSGLLRRVGGRVHAVEKVSLDLRAGETLSLVGESGCGKSTLGRTIMRLNQPQSGAVLLEGEDIARIDGAQLHKRRGDIQMVFQDPFASLNPRRKIGDTIAEPLLTHRLATRAGAREKALDLLDKVGLSRDMADRLPHEFSGGQRQRICIARALALNPKLLVADEAVSALDVSIKAQVINLMLDLQQELGLAYLFISHDMAVVERFSHRVAVMYLGEIVEIGTRAAIFGNPQHPYTRRLLSTVPVPDPSQRHRRRKMASFELRSPIRPLNFQPPERRYRVVGDDHLVHDWTDDWEK